jgi:Holliday junction resolvase
MPKDKYKYGREKEKKVARSLRSRGAKVTLSEGSKGAADLVAKFPKGKKWHVQVKSSRTTETARPTKKDIGRLKQVATVSGSTAVVAMVTPKKITYESAKTGRILSPTSRKATKIKSSRKR